MNDKQKRYLDLIERVKESYPPHDPADDSQQLRLYWCDDCKEINLWTYWQGRGNLDAKIMLVGQDWGSPWDESSLNVMEKITLANNHKPFDYLKDNSSLTDNRLSSCFRRSVMP